MQLQNVIVVFFLLNGVLQSIPKISTNTPLSSFVFVCWVILVKIIVLSEAAGWLLHQLPHVFKAFLEPFDPDSLILDIFH